MSNATKEKSASESQKREVWTTKEMDILLDHYIANKVVLCDLSCLVNYVKINFVNRLFWLVRTVLQSPRRKKMLPGWTLLKPFIKSAQT